MADENVTHDGIDWLAGEHTASYFKVLELSIDKKVNFFSTSAFFSVKVYDFLFKSPDKGYNVLK